jgi:hypothetical protein
MTGHQPGIDTGDPAHRILFAELRDDWRWVARGTGDQRENWK